MPKAETRPSTTRADTPTATNVTSVTNWQSGSSEPRGPATVTDLKAFREKRQTLPNADHARMTALLTIVLTPIMEEQAVRMALFAETLQLQHAKELRRLMKASKGARA